MDDAKTQEKLPFQHRNYHVMSIIIINVLPILCIGLLYLLWRTIRFFHKVWWIPSQIRIIMSSQGIQGPPYKFIYGNTKEITAMRKLSMGNPMDISHDIFPRIQPHVYSWTKIYGNIVEFFFNLFLFLLFFLFLGNSIFLFPRDRDELS